MKNIQKISIDTMSEQSQNRINAFVGILDFRAFLISDILDILEKYYSKVDEYIDKEKEKGYPFTSTFEIEKIQGKYKEFKDLQNDFINVSQNYRKNGYKTIEDIFFLESKNKEHIEKTLNQATNHLFDNFGNPYLKFISNYFDLEVIKSKLINCKERLNKQLELTSNSSLASFENYLNETLDTEESTTIMNKRPKQAEIDIFYEKLINDIKQNNTLLY